MDKNVNTLQAIHSLISESFPQASTAGLEDDTPLMESGMIDSLGLLLIIDLLEQRFGISVQDDEVTADNFYSIRNIAEYVDRKLNRSQG